MFYKQIIEVRSVKFILSQFTLNMHSFEYESFDDFSINRLRFIFSSFRTPYRKRDIPNSNFYTAGNCMRTAC